MRTWLVLAALSAFVAVAVGAFAAHAMNDERSVELLRTGAHYQLIHAVAVLACAGLFSHRTAAPMLFLAGSLLFSGSLYAMAFGAPRWMGMITPLGGVSFLAGWLVLAWRVWRDGVRNG